jgi:hypothetical protein
MNEQAREILRDVQDARIPDAVQQLAEETVFKTRAAYDNLHTVAKDCAQVIEEIFVTYQTGAKTIAAKALSNSVANTEAILDAAQTIARARTFPEAARLQANFVQQQLVVANQQTKELFDLYANVTKQTLGSLCKAAAGHSNRLGRSK